MEIDSQSDPKQLDSVESTLYNRMLRNAFIGFIKSAAIGAVIGLALGAIGAAITDASTIASGAWHGAAWIAGLTGSFGAVAGIQSTRDTRRFFLMHENQDLSPEQTTERGLAMEPEISRQPKAENHFRNMVADKVCERQAESAHRF